MSSVPIFHAVVCSSSHIPSLHQLAYIVGEFQNLVPCQEFSESRFAQHRLKQLVALLQHHSLMLAMLCKRYA